MRRLGAAVIVLVSWATALAVAGPVVADDGVAGTVPVHRASPARQIGLARRAGAQQIPDTTLRAVPWGPGRVELEPELPGPESTPTLGGIVMDPAEVVAGMFYSGTTVHVSTVVPSGTQVAMVCVGRAQPLTLNRKGKALGSLWMNVGEVSFEEVPTVYLVRTSTALDRLAPEPVLAKLGVGFAALEDRCDPDGNQGVLFADLVRLKERDGLWGVGEGEVRVQPTEEADAALASTEFRLPAKVPPGGYQVLVYAFGQGRGELVASGDIQVRQAGAAAFISHLARERGLLYGMLATGIAMVVGLATGLIFGMGSKGH